VRTLKTVGRWVGGALLAAVLVTAGVVVRTVVVGHQDQRAAADAIVVLGAAQYDGRPSPVFQARLDHALELYRADVSGHLVTLGGGQPGDRLTEAEAGRQYLMAKGVPPSAILPVGVGNDTLVSLRAAAGPMRSRGWVSMVLVTDPWHSARSTMMARDLGFHTEVSPVETGPATDPSVRTRYILRETLGTLFYRLTGGTSGAGTAVF
jgi:uncharacterized SAM-binding protein YcdF (DUF218 family)